MDSKRIQEITETGIRYLDDEGQEQFIDFQSCYDNYFARLISAEHLERIKQLNSMSDADIPKYVEEMKDWKEVGLRNIIGKPFPYIEFHTKPRIRFEFTTEDDFRAVTVALGIAGWMTHDLS